MRVYIPSPAWFCVGALVWPLANPFPGVASAQLDKQEVKCANSINKGAAKVAKAQAGDNSACVKDYGKDKIPSAEDCITSDPKGKVAKAISKIKTSDCTGGAPSFLPELKTSSSEIGDTMKNKDLKLVHAILGPDLDASIVKAADDKPGAGCQAAVAKAAGKCQDAKLGSFNRCKKDKLKAGDTDIEACLGSGTGGIPDGKGKIAKKCGNGLGGTIGKKCGVPNTDALFPPCAGEDLADCLDQKIECEVCRALNALDGLNRDCDLFDDGNGNESCLGGIGLQTCVLDSDTFCVGEDPNGQPYVDQPCSDIIFHSDCPPGPTLGDPNVGARCIGDSGIVLNTRVLSPLLTLALAGGLEFQCGEIDPNTQKAECSCQIGTIDDIVITGLGTVCITPGGVCPTGVVDCAGGTPLDVDVFQDHSIGLDVFALDPNQFGPTCGDFNPDGNEECSTMCDAYCASLPGSYVQHTSGCEGFCDGGSNDASACTNDPDCPGGDCVGAQPVTHGKSCQCQCIQIAGDPARAGALHCFLSAGIVLEQGPPCDSLDISIVTGNQCIPLTTEAASGELVDADVQFGQGIGPLFQQGSPISCADLEAGNLTGMTLFGDFPSLDSTLGDFLVPFRFICR